MLECPHASQADAVTASLLTPVSDDAQEIQKRPRFGSSWHLLV